MSDQQNEWWADDSSGTRPPPGSPAAAGTPAPAPGPVPPEATHAPGALGQLHAAPDATVVVPARHPGAPPADPGYGGTPAQYAPQPAPPGYQQPPNYATPNQATPSHPTPNYGNQPPGSIPPQAVASYGGPQFVAPSQGSGIHRAPGGAVTMMVGALVAIIGTFLPWVRFGNDSFNGYETYFIGAGFDAAEWTNPGAFVVGAMVLVIISAVVVLGAGRRVATWIIALLTAGFAGLMALGSIGAVRSVRDNAVSFDDKSIGFGVMLCLLGAVVSGIGAIIVSAKKS